MVRSEGQPTEETSITEVRTDLHLPQIASLALSMLQTVKQKYHDVLQLCRTARCRVRILKLNAVEPSKLRGEVESAIEELESLTSEVERLTEEVMGQMQLIESIVGLLG